MTRFDAMRIRRHWPVSMCLVLFAAGCGDSIHNYVAKADIAAASAMLDAEPALLEARNPWGKTPLFLAVTSGSTTMVQSLLDRGADVNVHDDTGLTPLHVAAWWTATDRAGQLLDAGADPNAKDHFGDTPLHVAAVRGRQSMTLFLAQQGADLRAKNEAGLTPRAFALAHGQDKTALLLGKLLAFDEEGTR